MAQLPRICGGPGLAPSAGAAGRRADQTLAIPKRRGCPSNGCSLHTVCRIPRALLLAHVDNLPDVVGVRGSDVGDGGIRRLQFAFVGGCDSFFPLAYYFMELLDGGVPLLAVEAGEGLVVIAVIFLHLLAFELLQGTAVPEYQVSGQLAVRM